MGSKSQGDNLYASLSLFMFECGKVDETPQSREVFKYVKYVNEFSM